MVQSSRPSGLIAGRHIAPDKFVDLGFDGALHFGHLRIDRIVIGTLRSTCTALPIGFS
jgi:hypothetical protein